MLRAVTIAAVLMLGVAFAHQSGQTRVWGSFAHGSFRLELSIGTHAVQGRDDTHLGESGHDVWAEYLEARPVDRPSKLAALRQVLARAITIEFDGASLPPLPVRLPDLEAAIDEELVVDLVQWINVELEAPLPADTRLARVRGAEAVGDLLLAVRQPGGGYARHRVPAGEWSPALPVPADDRSGGGISAVAIAAAAGFILVVVTLIYRRERRGGTK